MALDITTAQGALTGERYIESLKDSREVWLNDARADVTTHAAFAGMLHELVRLYDLQHTPEYRDGMTFVSPETGHRVSHFLTYCPELWTTCLRSGATARSGWWRAGANYRAPLILCRASRWGSMTSASICAATIPVLATTRCATIATARSTISF